MVGNMGDMSDHKHRMFPTTTFSQLNYQCGCGAYRFFKSIEDYIKYAIDNFDQTDFERAMEGLKRAFIIRYEWEMKIYPYLEKKALERKEAERKALEKNKGGEVDNEMS